MDNRIKKMISNLGDIVGTITEFDELAQELEKLSYNKFAALKAYLADECNGQSINVDYVIYAIYELSGVYFCRHIKTPADLGRCIAGFLGMDTKNVEFIDYEKLANDFGYIGRFTKDGFLFGEIRALPF